MRYVHSVVSQFAYVSLDLLFKKYSSVLKGLKKEAAVGLLAQDCKMWNKYKLGLT